MGEYKCHLPVKILAICQSGLAWTSASDVSLSELTDMLQLICKQLCKQYLVGRFSLRDVTSRATGNEEHSSAGKPGENEKWEQNLTWTLTLSSNFIAHSFLHTLLTVPLNSNILYGRRIYPLFYSFLFYCIYGSKTIKFLTGECVGYTRILQRMSLKRGTGNG